MKKQIFYLLGLIVVIGIACQKEESFELGNTPARGSLQSDASGDCLPKTVNGSYAAATPLVPTSNTITVTVDVARTGIYNIGTDTINGYYFRGTGQFTALGANTVTLRGNGTPFAAGVNNFVVSFDSTVCDIQVTVLPAGSGPATFTLAGAPNSCTTPVINGTYVKGGALNASNTVVLNVTVATAGSYNVSTVATNGMTFTGTGTLATGAQTITLVGSGTPTNSGNTTIPITVGTSTCSFVIPVVDPISGTLGGAPGACTSSSVNGTYTLNVALTASNTVTVQITTAAVGPYSVSTNTVAGIRFSASGTSTGATQTITLLGTGTPTASGPQNFTVTFGTSTCTFSINIGTGASAYTPDCSSAIQDGLYEVGTQLNCSNIIDIGVNVTATGPYTITTTAVNGMTFSASGTFTTLGSQTITLVGSGTPTTQGNSTITMPGSPTCTFTVLVDPTPTIDWSFRVTNAPATTYRGQADDVQLIPAGPSVGLGYAGSNSLGSDGLTFLLADINGTISNGETYSSSAPPTSNSAIFSYDLASSSNCSDTYSADPGVTGVTMIFTVTSHNVATKTVTGTFAGTAKNSAGQTITITTGTFRGTYP